MKSNTKYRLTPGQLKNACNPGSFKFKSTAELKPLTGTVGQERGVRAIEFGLGIKTFGYNVYVAGPVGTGKRTTVLSYVNARAKKEPVPNDLCYVNNFENPDNPIAVNLQPGKAIEFQKDMHEFLSDCRIGISRAFDDKEYEARRKKSLDEFQKERDALIDEFQKLAQEKGFSVQITSGGIYTVPVFKGKAMERTEFEKLPDDKKKKIKEVSQNLQGEIEEIQGKIKSMDKQVREKLKKLDSSVAFYAIGHLLENLKKKYKDNEKIVKYLTDIEKDIIDHLDDFKTSDQKEAQLFGVSFALTAPSFSRYNVNVIVDNSNFKGAPVVYETNPTYYNLFGAIEYRSQLGAMFTDFNMIKAGAIQRANGGYLILQAFDLLTSPFAWEALKRTLRSGEIRFENMFEHYRPVPVSSIQPELVPFNVKVIIMGNFYIYHLLYEMDEDFRRLFKVRADFDIEMKRDESHLNRYASFVSTRCQESKLKHFNPEAVARVVDYGSRLVDNKEKISTRFMEIADIISEASFWSEKEKNRFVSAADVDRAIEEKNYRSQIIEEKIEELIENGTIMIDTAGSVLGQVNGLSVYELGDYRFGKPSRITCITQVGKGGVLAIEREVKLSGPIHSKGVLILSGYLGMKFGHDKPLSLSASLCFEQLYEEIEGDSASSTELYALLSSLSGLPLEQGIAVTGSVNQYGKIQPIGGVNEKIEGFYTVCKAKGFTGRQGVIIPKQNIKNLMLRDEVIEAVSKNKFSIYAIEDIDEGVEILTSKNPGKPLKDGYYEKGSVYGLVEKKLRHFSKKIHLGEETTKGKKAHGRKK
jgi:predicted ATP-dependent protease